MKKLAVLGAFIVALCATGAFAQARDAVTRKQDWSVFKQGEAASRMCWIVSSPQTSTASKGGNPVDVNRGDIYLMVGMWPGDRIKNQVMMAGGYPYKKNSSVKVKIGSKTYEMFTEGEEAWTDSAASDDRLVSALKRGADAIVTGVSTRGTKTVDTFSLRGFTAALNEARKICR